MPGQEAIRRVAVGIQAGDGRTGGQGELEVADLTLRRRLRQAGGVVLGGLVMGALFLPVPLIHLLGVMAFLAALVVAARRLGVRQVVVSARGCCPSCRKEGSFFVGFGTRRLRFPVRTACPACQVELMLEPVGGGRPAL